MTFALVAATARPVAAELRLSSVFGDSMVLQRDAPIHVWGWTTPSREVTVTVADKSASATADDDGRFDVMLDALPAGGPHEMTIVADQERTFRDVLVGEVWLCSGQSNMQWSVDSSNDSDLESLAANYPDIRIISVPRVGTQTPQNDFDGQWQRCSPTTIKDFSAVGYFFGRQLHQTLDCPIGLIDNSWGGSAAEAWVNRDVMEATGKYDGLLREWDELAESYDHEAAMDKYRTARQAWEKGDRKGRAPRAPSNRLVGQHRPANLYNGVLMPVIGYTLKGVIWYQGESNSGRAYQYRHLFPMMIQNWRDEWKQGDFPFYWVQLADYRAEAELPGDSSWAELREAQTMTLSKLPNTGEAVIVDLGEAEDIHPKNKQDVAKRLARWALANDYGFDIPFRSPTYASHEIDGDRIRVTFDHVGGGLDTFDVRRPIGFAIAGEDKVFHRADAKIVGKMRKTVEVSSDQVASPVAVRYAWADNPVCNVQSRQGLQLTPFRTDTWPGATSDSAVE